MNRIKLVREMHEMERLGYTSEARKNSGNAQKKT